MNTEANRGRWWWLGRGLRRALSSIVSFDRRIPEDPGTHKLLLGITAAMLILPFFLTVPEAKQECLYCAGWKIPGACPSKEWLNTECPGCGMTHAFVCLTHGRFRDAVGWNRMGLLLYGYFVFQAALRIRILLRPETARHARIVTLQHYASWAMIVLLLGNWVVSFWLGGNGS